MASERIDPTEGNLPSGIGQPALRAFANAGYHRLEQFAGVSAAELARLHGVGPKAIRLLREALAAQGLAFRDESSN
jgi:predicted flap endonuclease-1-like 5' DNA nuclease